MIYLTNDLRVGVYKEFMGPTRLMAWKEVVERTQKGWCWRVMEVDRNKANWTQESLKEGLARARKECVRLRALTYS